MTETQNEKHHLPSGDEEKAHPHSPDGPRSVDDGTALAVLQHVRMHDEHHPIHWGSLKKWVIVFFYCLLQVFVTLTTTTYLSAEFLVMEKYGGTTQVVSLGQSMFIIGTAVGPAFLGPLSYVPSPRPSPETPWPRWVAQADHHHHAGTLAAGNGSTSAPSSSTPSSTSAAHWH